MATTSGFSLISLLGGLMDSSSTDQLSSAIRDALSFIQEDHRFVISIHTSVDPKRKED